MRFGAASYAIVLRLADLSLPLQTANPWLAEMHDRLVAERIERLDPPAATPGTG